jgi:hypothetical protein
MATKPAVGKSTWNKQVTYSFFLYVHIDMVYIYHTHYIAINIFFFFKKTGQKKVVNSVIANFQRTHFFFSNCNLLYKGKKFLDISSSVLRNMFLIAIYLLYMCFLYLSFAEYLL